MGMYEKNDRKWSKQYGSEMTQLIDFIGFPVLLLCDIVFSSEICEMNSLAWTQRYAKLWAFERLGPMGCTPCLGSQA